MCVVYVRACVVCVYDWYVYDCGVCVCVTVVCVCVCVTVVCVASCRSLQLQTGWIFWIPPCYDQVRDILFPLLCTSL